MKERFLKSLEHSKELSVQEIGKHFLLLLVWTVVKFLLIFQPNNPFNITINVVVAAAISWHVLMVGAWYGRHDILNVIHNGIADSPENELTGNLIKIIGGNKNEK